MEIFKLFESTLADLQSADNIKHLRRDQLQDNCEASAKILQTLIRAKECEIAYRKDLIKMLEESKTAYELKLARVKQDYQTVKNNAPASIDIKSIGRLDASILNERSTTPPMPPPPTPPPPPPQANKQSQNQVQIPVSIQPTVALGQPMMANAMANNHQMPPPPPPPPMQMQNMINSNQIPGASAIPTIVSNQPNPIHWTPSPSHSSNRGSDLDLSIPALNSRDNHENRSSLDRRLSEFLKTFPNISQAGLVPPSSIDTTKPPPGYYTQQPPQPLQPPGVVPPPHQPAATSGYQHHYHHGNSRSIEK